MMKVLGGLMKTTNIKDVAKASGVAVSTVSRVINNHTDVKEETRTKVLEIIDALNYVPNNSARNLKRVNSKSIGIFVRGEYNFFFAELIESIEKEIALMGYTAVIHFQHCEDRAIEYAAQFVLEKRLIGLIYLGGVVEQENEGYLKNLDIPVVFASTVIGPSVEKSLFSSVSIDNIMSSKKAVEHLVTLGHNKIGMISAMTSDQCIAQERYTAYTTILAQNNLIPYYEFLERGDYSFESGYEGMTKLLDKKLGVTAVFVISDIMAIGAIRSVVDHGMRVPEDISIVGFDGLDYGRYYTPSLTTIEQPKEALCKESCRILFGLLEGGTAMEHIVLDTKLLERESSRRL